MEQPQTRKNKPHTRPKRRVITHTIGPWAWNQDNLKSKIVEADSELSCYGWKGSTGPETHLFGGFKNGVSQMNQARRLYWMGEYNEDIADKRITMTCKNTHCMNIEHMKLAPNLKLFKDDGITPAQPQRKKPKRLRKQPPIMVYNKELEKW